MSCHRVFKGDQHSWFYNLKLDATEPTWWRLEHASIQDCIEGGFDELDDSVDVSIMNSSFLKERLTKKVHYMFRLAFTYVRQRAFFVNFQNLRRRAFINRTPLEKNRIYDDRYARRPQ